MIGIVYAVKSNEYIGIHPEQGFFHIETLKHLDSSILWISNLKKENIKSNNIKPDNFFNSRLKDIIYYFNINSLPAEEQLSYILKVYKSILDIFKEEYSFFNLKIEELFKFDNFSEILFKSNIKNVKSQKLTAIKKDFNKEVFFENLNSNKFFIAHFNSSDFISSLFDLQIPCGNFEIIPIEKYTNHKDPFMLLDSLSKEFGFMIKCKVKDDDVFMKTFFKEKDEYAWFTDVELLSLRGNVELEATHLMLFEERFRLKEVMRTRFKTNYSNIAFEIFVKNILISLEKNNIDTLDIWIESYQKVFYFKKIIEMMDQNIEIGYYSGNNIVMSIDSISKIESLENIGLIYPIKLISYILNN